MNTEVVAYVPVLHAGYLKFFREFAGARLWVLSREVAEDIPELMRDIRALCPEREIVPMLLSTGIFRDVCLLNRNALYDWDVRTRVYNGDYRIVAPDETEMRFLAERNFAKFKVEFRSVFLRWDRSWAEKEISPDPDIEISRGELDRELMTQAYGIAEKSPDWWRQIGALVVRGGRIIASAYNAHMPDAWTTYVNGDPRTNYMAGERIDLSSAIHAEASVIARAARDGIALGGASIYVTTFPCPPCARSIVMAGFRRVFYKDGYSLLDARGILKGAGIAIVRVSHE